MGRYGADGVRNRIFFTLPAFFVCKEGSTMPKLKEPDSKLVSYVWNQNTTHYNPRNHAIDTITIHHAANGEGCNKGYAVNTLNVIFASCGAAGSVQYGIDSNGKIGQMLAEKYRCWCSNSRSNDHRAICIEVANCDGKPNWPISEKAMKALIELCADICKRNGKKKIVWISDKAKALAYSPKADEMRMTLHKWVSENAATGCPEKYLSGKMGYIADEVNKILNPTAAKPAFEPYIIRVTYMSGMNVRKGAGVAYPVVMTVPKGGVYTIVEEKTIGSQRWGKLKSGAGWICLTGFTERVNK